VKECLLADLALAQAKVDRAHLRQSHAAKAKSWMRLAGEAKHAAERVSVYPKYFSNNFQSRFQ
jgi:hypothetical protein